MKTKIKLIILMLLSAVVGIQAQDVVTVEAASVDISENLDLEAVAVIFGEAEDLEDFEYKLNDPELRISNLDLNEDGYVDYLRVVELAEGETHLIVIQAVLGEDLFQDVATLDVEKDDDDNVRVQVVGDVYMYGPDYIIEPVYVHRPIIFGFFWSNHYHHWYSPWYWGYYPHHWHYWNVHPVHVYHSHIWTYRPPTCHFYYRTSRRSKVAGSIHQQVHRNDYAKANPERSFVKRNTGVKNKSELKSDYKKTERPNVDYKDPTTKSGTKVQPVKKSEPTLIKAGEERLPEKAKTAPYKQEGVKSTDKKVQPAPERSQPVEISKPKTSTQPKATSKPQQSTKPKTISTPKSDKKRSSATKSSQKVSKSSSKSKKSTKKSSDERD